VGDDQRPQLGAYLERARGGLAGAHDFGAVAQSLGFKGNIFNTAEGRLSALHDDVMQRVGPR
jgi:hypothetical protein